jgi:hypothetical protein
MKQEIYQKQVIQRQQPSQAQTDLKLHKLHHRQQLDWTLQQDKAVTGYNVYNNEEPANDIIH